MSLCVHVQYFFIKFVFLYLYSVKKLTNSIINLTILFLLPRDCNELGFNLIS